MDNTRDRHEITIRMLGESPSDERRQRVSAITMTLETYGIWWLAEQAAFYAAAGNDLTDRELHMLADQVELAADKIDDGMSVEDMRRPMF